MNRVIKFRVWDKLTNKFLFEDFHLIGEVMVFGLIDQWLKEYPVEGYGSLERMNELVFQQFTGIKDKNGKEIFEGDFLKTEGQLIGQYFRQGSDSLPAFPDNTFYAWTSKVIWDEGYACYLLEYINQPEYNGRGNFKDEMIGIAPWGEIIGNIFESPELFT